MSLAEVLPSSFHVEENSLRSQRCCRSSNGGNFEQNSESFDYERKEKHIPNSYQLFKICHERCHKLEVTVIQGRGITRGKLKDWLNKPNSFVGVRAIGTPNGQKKTQPIPKTSNPTWNETLTFYIDPIKDTRLEFVLYDLNLTVNEEIGRRKLDIKGLDSSMEETVTLLFKNGSAIDVTLKIVKNLEPSLRFDLRLCDEELDFVRSRREKVFAALNQFIGEECQMQMEEVPKICIMTSGGGFRAMIACSGVYKALQSEGLLDCASYVAALSGSSWYTSTLFSHPEFPHPGVAETIIPELRECVEKHWQVHLSPPWSSRYLKKIIRKSVNGQPVSFTDFFGYLVGQQLLNSRMKSKLSDQREKIADGKAPMPIYTCLHVKSNVSAKMFQEWYEFTPYEVGIPKYGVFMKSNEFASKFYMGQVVKKFPEVPLHFLSGIWGSAFTILFKRFVQEKGKNGVDEIMRMVLMDKQDPQCSSEEEAEDDEDCEKIISRLTKDLVSADDEDHFEMDKPSSSIEPQSSLMLKDEFYQGRYKPYSVSTSDDELNDPQSEVQSDVHKNAVSLKEKLLRKYSFRKVSSNTKKSEALPRSMTTNNVRISVNAKESNNSGETSYFDKVLEKALTTTPIDSRAFRAGVILNPFRGLTTLENNCNECSKITEGLRDPTDDDFKDYKESMKTDDKKIYLVDSGLSFNLPFPLTLRPQRGIQLYLTFDFSSRKSDSTPPFRELLLAEKWAQLHGQPFPPIKKTVKSLIGCPNKECYVFKDTENIRAPVILFFPIVNSSFRKYSAPGEIRNDEEEKTFGDFKIFDDTNAYAIWRFVYPNLSFDRMTSMMEYNVKNNVHIIRYEIIDLIERRRKANMNPLALPTK
nr:LOW QUALITY PROTEIN: cytosolic phospholipase A2-like [Lepeophtheirus salmonis]